MEIEDIMHPEYRLQSRLSKLEQIVKSYEKRVKKLDYKDKDFHKKNELLNSDLISELEHLITYWKDSKPQEN